MNLSTTLTGLCLALTALLVTPSSAVAEPMAELSAVQFSPDGEKTQILVESANPVQFHASVSARPYRLELIFDAATATPRARAGSGFGLVRTFYADAATGHRTRILFDLTGPATIVSATIRPGESGKPAHAVIELAPSDAIAMAATVGTIYRPTEQAKVIAALPQPANFGPMTVKKPATVEKKDGRLDAGPRAAVVAATPKPASLPPAKPAVIAATKRTIVIDPGHGGIDPGADSVAGYREKEITLATALVLKKTLEDTGRYRVVLTRSSDVYLKLQERVIQARKAHGDLFISLHADSFSGAPLMPVAERRARGARRSIHCQRPRPTPRAYRYAQRENRADLIGGVDLKDQSDDVAGILVDLTMKETVSEGNRFAGILVGRR